MLTKICAITSSGMVADINAFHKTLQLKIKQYQIQFKKSPSTHSIAKMVSNQLYSRRFFPYYSFNLVAGIDEEGKGVCFGYDAIGSYDAVTYGIQGSGNQLGVPILDN